MNWLELFLGKIPEAIFLALFLVFAKNIKNKRILFVLYVTVEYLLLKLVFSYSSYFHILLAILIYIGLKGFYRERSQITDVFILVIAYFYLGLTSVACYYLCAGNVVIAALVNRLILFIPLLCLNYKISCIQKLYKVQWNRGHNGVKIKSTTFRGANLVLMHLTFVFIHCYLIFGLANNL